MQNMESSLKGSEKRRMRKKKKQRGLKGLRRNGLSPSPSRKLGVMNQNVKKRKSKRSKLIAKQCLQSVINSLCQQHISFESNPHNLTGQSGEPSERTIDLCEADNSADNANSTVLMVPSPEAKLSEVVIDLSKDLSDQAEVIDLTETSMAQCGECSGSDNLEPTVIDITEEESREQPVGKPENDDVFVIGTFSKNSNKKMDCNRSVIPLSKTKNNFSKLINCSEKLKTKYLKKQSVLDRVCNNSISQFRGDILKRKSPLKVTRVGENVYVNSPVTFPSHGLRPIIIDGSNVAFVHSNSNFSCKRLEICINYFKEKGHKVTAFVPQFRFYNVGQSVEPFYLRASRNSHRSDNPQLLRKLEKQGDVVLTPSKKIDGRNIVPYDDRFIVQTAVLKGGIIVSRDNYNDLLRENPAWAETIKYRTLAFTWVDDVLMFPKDPLGEFGPSLEEFLRFH